MFVCVNCHLVDKSMKIEAPLIVALGTLIEAVQILYYTQIKRLLTDGVGMWGLFSFYVRDLN